MINQISILMVCYTVAFIQIPEYTSGSVSLGGIGGTSYANPLVNSVTKVFSITFTAIPQIYFSTSTIHQRQGQLCYSQTVTSISKTEFTIQQTWCSEGVWSYSVSYLAVNDPYVYIYGQTISPTTSSTNQLINFGNYNWLQVPAYSIAIIGLQLQTTLATYSNMVTISQISITSATIVITQNNPVGPSYNPIEFNIIFACPEFLTPVKQLMQWSSDQVLAADLRYIIAKPVLQSSASKQIKFEGFSGIAATGSIFFRLFYNRVSGYVSEENILYPEFQLDYSAFIYQPFVCNGTTNGNQCTCPNKYYITYSGCLQCSNSCATCVSSSTNCLSCNSNAFLSSGVCICNNGYFMNAGLSCQQCNPSCLTCNTQSTFCTSCLTGKVAILGQCQTCPVKNQILNGVCIPCQLNCDTCYQAYCTQCSVSFLYQTAVCNDAIVTYLGLLYQVYLMDQKNKSSISSKQDQVLEEEEPLPIQIITKKQQIIRIDLKPLGDPSGEQSIHNRLSTPKTHPLEDFMSNSKLTNSRDGLMQISKIQAYILFVKQFHMLFSIFYKFDKQLSRPVRCTIYYISTLGILSTIFMFGKSANISLNIAITLILAPMSKIFSLIFEKLISHKKSLIQYCGIILMASVCGFWSYMLLTQIALLGDVYEVNQLTVNFLLTWCFDTCIYAPIQLVLQFLVQTYIFKLTLIRRFLQFLLDEDSQQFIENLSRDIYN